MPFDFEFLSYWNLFWNKILNYFTRQTHISIYTIYFIFWYCVRNLNSKSEGTHLHPYIIGVICQVSVGKLRVLSVILAFGTLRSVWHSSRRKYWNRGRWARKTGSNGSGIWQKDMSQNIVKRLVFLGPTATVHWHFYKKKNIVRLLETGQERRSESERKWEDSDKRER